MQNNRRHAGVLLSPDKRVRVFPFFLDRVRSYFESGTFNDSQDCGAEGPSTLEHRYKDSILHTAPEYFEMEDHDLFMEEGWL